MIDIMAARRIGDEIYIFLKRLKIFQEESDIYNKILYILDSFNDRLKLNVFFEFYYLNEDK